MANYIQNGGFEQSTATSTDPSPFWTGGNVQVEGNGNQLLGINNIRIDVGGFISQALFLEVGREYTFKAAVRNAGNSGGTLEIFITGNQIRSFNTGIMTREPYAFYEFDFTAINAASTLVIGHTSGSSIRLDVISVVPVKL
ncbi:hypothetical protein AWW70_21390 [Bacillus mycoides]|uniref:CBM-cenC domain-containing protein n=1 Tax=Bacillus mycoides TaxID=1405 RepID=A0A120EDL0_BACMY|nr:hypothetical protein [Bacillus mycoides]KWU57731.1 hypothetical protein AWW70_21390 [Bacillus mycoides]